MKSRRIERVLTALLIISVVGFGAVLGMMFTLPLVGQGAAALNFLGSLIGAAFASGAAIIAVEWQTNRNDRERQRIVIDLLRQAESAFTDYGGWIDAGAPDQRREFLAGRLTVLVGSIRESLEISRELRASTFRMARVAMLLGHEMRNLFFLEGKVHTSPLPDIGTPECKDAVGHVITAAIAARHYLEH